MYVHGHVHDVDFSAATNKPPASMKRKEPDQHELQLRVITGDELGLIRVAEVPAGPKWEGTQVAAKWGVPDKSKSVTALAISSPEPSSYPVLAVARAGGDIDVLQASDGTHVATIAKAIGDASGVKITGLAFLPPNVAGEVSPGRLVSCTASGLVRIHAPLEAEAGSSGRGAESAHCQWTEQTRFQTCGKVACMAMDASGCYIAVGGEGCHVQVWHLAKQQAVFKAKGGKPNMVGLVDLPNITALAFLPRTEPATDPAAPSSPEAPTCNRPSGDSEDALPLRVLAGTAQHKLWLYDLLAGKRPQLDVAWGDARITALAPEPDGKRVWVANGQGVMESLDIAAKKVSGGLRGAGGSTRAMQLHHEFPVVAAVGLDRYLRLYDAFSRKCLCKVYLKQQLTSVVFAPALLPLGASEQPPEQGQSEESHHAVGCEAITAEAEEEQGLGKPRPSKRQKSGGRNGKRKARPVIG